MLQKRLAWALFRCSQPYQPAELILGFLFHKFFNFTAPPPLRYKIQKQKNSFCLFFLHLTPPTRITSPISGIVEVVMYVDGRTVNPESFLLGGGVEFLITVDIAVFLSRVL